MSSGYGVAPNGPQGPIAPDGGQPFVASAPDAPMPQGGYGAAAPSGAVAFPPGQPSPYGQVLPPLPPEKPKRKKRGRLLFWVMLLIFLLALGALGYIAFTYWNGQQAYEEVSQHAQVEGDELALFSVDWDALRAINPDVVAWIYVPDTPVNYPVVWRQDDNEYYLGHNFNGVESPQFGAEYGCPALSGSNNPDFTDDINIISGHNLLNGEMFSVFSTFNDSEVFNEHRTIYLLTPDANYRLRTFSLDYIYGFSTVPIRFASKQDMTDYIQQCLDETLVDAEPPLPVPAEVQRAFAFYTCDNLNNTYRYFIFSYVQDYVPLGVTDIPQDIAGNEDVAAVSDASQERAE